VSRLRDVIEAARARGERALVAYLTAGDPSFEVSLRVLLEAARRGADIIELGVPWSDPSADGVAIQGGMLRALAGGMRLPRALELARAFRRESDVPVVLFGYFNPILSYGCERLATDAAAAGVDGLLVVDLPLDEADELRLPARAAGLDWVPLLAPTSTPARIARAAEVADGFVYYVSMTGVTGAALAPALAEAEVKVAELRKVLKQPIAVGFGVATPDDARLVGGFADAVVVGSALVREIEQAVAAGRDPAAAVGERVAGLKAALKG